MSCKTNPCNQNPPLNSAPLHSLGDLAVLGQHDRVDLERGLDGVGLVVDPLELLEGATLGLNTKEVPGEGLNEIPADKDKDVLVLDVSESDGRAELVDEGDGVDDETRRGETLGAHRGLESLGGDDTLEGSVGEGEDDVEKEVRGKSTTAVVEVDERRVALTLDGGGDDDLGVVKRGSETRVGGEGKRAQKGTGDENYTAGHAIGKRDGGESTNGRETLVENVVAELGGDLGDAKVLENDRVEVSETVARELTEDGDHEHLSHSPAAVVGEEERAVVPPHLVDAVELDALPHLLNLELDELGVGVLVAVILDKEGDGLLLAAVGHEVTGGLGEEEDGAHDDDASSSLEDQGNAPRVVVVDVVGAESDNGSRDGTTEPTAVVETGAAATPVWGGNLDGVGGSGDGHDGDTETEYEAADDELGDLA